MHKHALIFFSIATRFSCEHLRKSPALKSLSSVMIGFVVDHGESMPVRPTLYRYQEQKEREGNASYESLDLKCHRLML